MTRRMQHPVRPLDVILAGIPRGDVLALEYALVVAGQAELAHALLDRREVLQMADDQHRNRYRTEQQ